MKLFLAILLVVIGTCAGVHNYKRLTLLSDEYSATGTVTNYIPGVDYLFPKYYTEIQVNSTAELLYWDQYFIKVWCNKTTCWELLTLVDGSTECYTYHGYGFERMNEEYSKAVSLNEVGTHKMYVGNVIDVGSCCDDVAVTLEMVEVPGSGISRMEKFHYSQFVPSFWVYVQNTTVTLTNVRGVITYNNYGQVNASKFVLPAECTTPDIKDFCVEQYEKYGWCNTDLNVAVPFHTTIPSTRNVRDAKLDMN